MLVYQRVFRFLYFISCQCVGTSKIPALLDGTRSFAASLTWSMSQKGNVAPGVVLSAVTPILSQPWISNIYIYFYLLRGKKLESIPASSQLKHAVYLRFSIHMASPDFTPSVPGHTEAQVRSASRQVGCISWYVQICPNLMLSNPDILTYIIIYIYTYNHIYNVYIIL